MENEREDYHFIPPMTPHISSNAPCLDPSDHQALSSIVEVQINDQKAPGVSDETFQIYVDNMEDQSTNKCLSCKPSALAFLKDAVKHDLTGLPEWLWSQISEGDSEEKKLVLAIKLALTDFYTSCCAPDADQPLNERMRFIGYVIPVIKAYNAAYKRLHMQWVHKGFPADKSIDIGQPSEEAFPRKLVDGIGICAEDRTERLIVKSSSDVDAGHASDDMLKIIEHSIECLRVDMSNHKYAAFDTFKRRRMLGLQYVGNKLSLVSTGVLDKSRWSCVLVRSAVIPHAWQERHYWVKVFELLLCMDSILQEQSALSEILVDEDVSGTIEEQKTVKYNFDHF